MMGFLGNALSTKRDDVNSDGEAERRSPFTGTTSADLNTNYDDARKISQDSQTAARPVGEAALSSSGTAFADYDKLFAKGVDDAMSYDSPAELERVRQEAAGNANTAGDVAEASRRVALSRMGVNPGSDKFSAPDNAASVARTIGVADSMNRAVADRRDKAIMLRGQTAGMAGSAASSFAGLGINAFNAGVPALAAATQAKTAQGGFDANMYATAVRDSIATGDQNVRRQENTGKIINTAMSSFFGSSKKIKTGGAKLDDEKVLERVMKIPVRSWKYKEGEGDGGKHIGPYAEDVQRELGDNVAPGGRVIDVISMHGVALASIRALNSKVEQLERKAA